MSMFARRWIVMPAALACAALVTLTALSHAQGEEKKSGPLPKPIYGDFFMSAKIGSFKMLPYNDDKPPEGHFEMSFTGTVLVDTSDAVKHPRGLKTTIKTEGAVKQEINYHGRIVFHGSGKIIVDGGWHALQWFGRDMTGHLNGSAVFRLNGEFDKNLETGYYWYTNGKKADWGTGGMLPTCPESIYTVANPTVKINGKGH